jgi:hypothetical protein
VVSSGALSPEVIVREGVSPDVDALAAASGHRLSVIVWNYSDNDMALPADVALGIRGLVGARPCPA